MAVLTPPTTAVDPTGNRESSATFNAWVRSEVKSGDTLRLHQEGTYLLNGYQDSQDKWRSALNISDKRDLTVEWNDALLRTTVTGGRERRNRSHLRLQNLVGCIIAGDPRIEGPCKTPGYGAFKSALEAQHGIDIAGCVDLEFTGRPDVRNVHGDALYFGAYNTSTQHVLPSDIRIPRFFFDGTGRQGVGVGEAEGVVLGSTPGAFVGRRAGRAFVDLEPGTPGSWVSWVILRHLLCERSPVDTDVPPFGLNYLAAHGQGHVDAVVMEDCRAKGKAMGFDIRAPAGLPEVQPPIRRSHIHIVRCGSDTPGAGAGGFVRGLRLDDSLIVGNDWPINTGRHDQGAFYNQGDCHRVLVEDNNLPIKGSGTPPEQGPQTRGAPILP